MATEEEPKTKAKKVFASAVKKQLGTGLKKWTGAQSQAVVQSFSLDKKGNVKALSEEGEKLIRLICNPTTDLQMEIIQKVFDDNEVELSKDAAGYIRRVLNPQAFETQLVNARKLTKEDKPARGKLKDLLEEDESA